MANPKPSFVIKCCLDSHLAHNEPRVAGWYNDEMEVQVNVARGQGEPVDGNLKVFCGEGLSYQWYNIRIPKDANTSPVDNDREMKYPLERHVESIGMTGWNWVKRRSVRVGFDFDAITGHAEGVGICDEQLEEIRNKLKLVPEALILRSTGGLGLHIYFEFPPDALPETANHTEHAGLALACMKKISTIVGFDFQAGLDVGGGNMWIWHSKMTPENKGLSILKDNIAPDGSRAYMTPPDNWRLYIDVATRKRQKVRIEGVPDDEQDELSDKAAAQKSVPLEVSHKRIIADLQQNYSQYSTVWVAEHHLLQTHTYALKLYQKFREDTGEQLVGVFDTLSEGRDPSKPNCFCFPLPGGGFRVVRFGKGAREHSIWQSDKGGWTYTYYNQALDFFRAAAAYSGLEDDSRRFTFSDGDSATSAVRAMGHQIEVPDELSDRKVTLNPKGGKLIVEVESQASDAGTDIVGWIKKGKKWIRVYNINVMDIRNNDSDFEEIDNNVRVAITTNNTLSGWYVKHEQGMWLQMAKDDARSKLKSLGHSDTVEGILGTVISKAWIQVNIPFREEYPGNRQWNLNSAQLMYTPATDWDFTGPSRHPHWDMVLEHVGQELDEYLVQLPWAVKNNILFGRDYLLVWIACMIREPFEPLPYLYLHGPQNSGKSILHEALTFLMTRGVMRSDTALTNLGDFNGELAGAILCVIEEKDITKAGASAYNKIKDWVTSPTISIHAKHKQVYQQKNSTHWIQCANNKTSCPIFPGDTRITMIHVPDLLPGKEVPRATMYRALIDEAPYFLASLLHVQLPDIEQRLRLPIVATSNKDQVEDSNQTDLEAFMAERCYYVPGAKMLFANFYNAFMESLSSADAKSEWNKQRVLGALPTRFPTGAYTANNRYIGNIAFEQQEPMSYVMVCRDKKLIKKDI